MSNNISNREENFKKGLMLCDFLKENELKVPFIIDTFPVTSWELFAKSHCNVLQNEAQFKRSYQVWRTWYMRAYQAKKLIENNTKE